jgi:hypothetical protein
MAKRTAPFVWWFESVKASRMSQDAAKTSYRQKEYGVGIKIITGD